jgi:hypothetical protein
MPRIPDHQIIDEWEDDEFEIRDDNPRDRKGHKIPARESREDLDWEKRRREKWRKRRDD